MGMLAALDGFIHRSKQLDDKRARYIFYKIVDISSEEFTLQCFNTKVVFHLKIEDIVFDTDILHGLHPTQACYIGIRYSKYLGKIEPSALSKNQPSKLKNHLVSRYGKYNLRYENRKGDLYFTCEKSNQEFTMDPRDIALSEELIAEFDASQAFYIGLLAGLKLNNPRNKTRAPQKPYLRLME